MKKSKIILAVILAMVMLFALTAVAACKETHVCGHVCPTCNKCKDDSCKDPVCKDKCTCTPEPEGTWALQNITLGGTYKTEYQLNEAFSANGLTVSAVMQNVETSAKRTDDVTANAHVDSGKFNSAVVGSYVISVSYTYNDVTRYAHYSVTVKGSEPQINGISMTKTTVDYDVPEGSSTVNVNLDDITVKAVNGNGEVESTPLDASAYTLTFYRGGQQVDNLQTAAKGSYTIQAERKSDHQKAFIVVYVLDPATKIEFKAGTLTQSQALTNEMSSTWTFTVTDRSGTTHELNASDVELSSMNTLVAGSYTATASYNEYDGKGQPAAPDGLHVTVDYTITKNDELVNQSYAVNMSAIDLSKYPNNKFEVKPTNEATDGVLNVAGGISLIAGSDSKGTARTITIEADGNSAKKCGTKMFSNRLKFGGKSDKNQRLIKLELKGASLITVYAKSGSGSEARGIGLYSDATVAASSRLDSTEKMSSTITPLTFLVDKAGTYYIAAPDGDVNIYYIQIDTVLTGEAAEGQESVTLPTATVVSGITLNTESVQKDFVKGDTFNYTGLVVSKTIYNPVTAEATSEVVESGYSVSTPDMTVQGKPTVTVTLDGKTATYSINVNSLVEGVNGIKVTTEKATVEVENADATVELKDADFVVKTDAGATVTAVQGAAAGQCSNLKFELFAENGIEPLASWIVGAGTYKVKVTATYNNSTIAGTTDFTAECTVTVKVKAASGTVDTSDSGISFNDLVAADYTTGDISGIGTVGVTNKDIVSVSVIHTTTDKLSIKAKNGTIAEENYSYTKAFNTQGKSSTLSRSLLFELNAQYNYKITVYAKSGSSTGTGRYVTYYQCAQIPEAKVDFSGAAYQVATETGTSAITSHEITIDTTKGSYVYIGGGAGIEIYYIVVSVTSSNVPSVNTNPSEIAFGELVTGTYTAAVDESTIGKVTVSNTDIVTVSVAHTTTDRLIIKETSGTIADTTYNYTKVFSTQGGSRTTRRALLLELNTDYNYKITVYAKAGGEDRYVTYYQCAQLPTSAVNFGAADYRITGDTAVSATDISKHEISVNKENGAYVYIGADANIDIYYIVVSVVE